MMHHIHKRLRTWLSSPISSTKLVRKKSIFIPKLESLEDRTVPSISYTLNTPTWSQISPAPVTNAQNQSVNKLGAGAIESFAIDPQNSNIAFVGTVAGGVWRTMNFDSANPSSVIWTPLNDQLPSLYIGAIAIDPNNPSVLYAGTGSFSAGSDSGIAQADVGVIKFTNVLAPNVNNISYSVLNDGGQFNGNPVRSLVVSRTNPNVIMVGMYDPVGNAEGLYVTQNGGQTWSKAISGPTTSIIQDPNPGRSSTFYAGVVQTGVPGSQAGVFRTDNNGLTWTEIDNINSPINHPIVGIGDTQVGLAASLIPTLNGQYLTVLYEANVTKGALSSVWRYAETTVGAPASATTWSQFGTAPNTNGGGQGNLHFSIVADPSNPNILYIGGDANQLTTYGNIYQGTFNPSNPASSFWAPLSPGGTNPHADSRNMYIVNLSSTSTAETLIEVDDGGIFRVVNPTAASGSGDQQWNSLAGNLANLQVYSAGYDTQNNQIFVGTQDNGSSGMVNSVVSNKVPGVGQVVAPIPIVGGQSTVVNSGDGTTQAYSAPENTRYSLDNNYGAFVRETGSTPGTQLLMEAPGSTVQFSGLDNSAGFNTNDFQYSQLGFEIGLPIAPNRFSTTTPPPPSAAAFGDLLFGRYALYFSMNKGDTIYEAITPWTNAFGFFTGEKYTSIVFGGMSGGFIDQKTFYAGTDAGRLIQGTILYDTITAKVDVNFTDLTANLAGTGITNIKQIIEDPADENHIWVLGSNGQIAVSSDGGNTFSLVTSNLLTLAYQVDAITLIDTTPTVPGAGTLVAGGAGGVYYLDTATGNWSKYGTFPNVIVDSLSYELVNTNGNPLDTTGILVAGTLGRSAWIASDTGYAVTVTGGLNDTGMSMEAPSTEQTQYVFNDGQGNTQSFSRYSVSKVIFNTTGPNTTVTIGSNGLQNGNTSFMDVPIVVNMAGLSNDTLVVDNAAVNTNLTTTVTQNTINNGPTDNILGNFGEIDYTGITHLVTNFGNGNDHLIVSGGTTFDLSANFGSGNNIVDLSQATGLTGFQLVAGTGTNQLLAPANPVNQWTITNLNSGYINTPNYNFNGFSILQGGGGNNLATFITPANSTITYNMTIGNYGGFINDSLLGVSSNFGNFQDVTLMGGAGGINSLIFNDQTNGTLGSMAAPQTGIVYAPVDATSGNITTDLNAFSPAVHFHNINGDFIFNGDPNNLGKQDVFSFLGLSTSGMASGGPFNETLSSNGADTIFVTDSSVNDVNTAIGGVRGVSFASNSSGGVSIGNLYVRGGNEANPNGDTFVVTPSSRVNILIDGNAPSTPPGDKLTVNTAQSVSVSQITNPVFGPVQTRITQTDGAYLDYVNIESVSGIAGVSAGSLASEYAVASDIGVPSQVTVFNAATGTARLSINPYLPSFTGGVHVTLGDLSGNGIPDIIVAPGAGGGPNVKVYNGITGQLMMSFFAFEPSFTGGVSIAVGDIFGNGYPDIICGAGTSGGPRVTVFDGRTGQLVSSFFAFLPVFTGGISVAVGDVYHQGYDDIVVGAGPGGGPEVAIFDGKTDQFVSAFFAYSPLYSGGVTVSVGDINGDGFADIITSPISGALPIVNVFSGGSFNIISSFNVNQFFAPGAQSNVPVQSGPRVAAADIYGNGQDVLVVGKGATGDLPRVFIVNPATNPVQQLFSFSFYDSTFGGGVNVGGLG